MKSMIARRFRGLLPIVIDIETTGLHSDSNALLEMAAVFLTTDHHGLLLPDFTQSHHIEPFQGAEINAEALMITKIDPTYPLRFPIPEAQALYRLFHTVQQQLARFGCYRAILTGHNAWFDLSFILAAAKRCHIKGSPFHSFTTLDTASLAAVALGETVLARATRRAKIPFNIAEAHSAIYDAERTAELFCYIANRWK